MVHMNFLDALKTRKAIKRRGEEYARMTYDPHLYLYLKVGDLLAEDWEVEPKPEKKIVITKTEYFHKAAELLKQYDLERSYQHATKILLEELPKMLGFE